MEDQGLEVSMKNQSGLEWGASRLGNDGRGLSPSVPLFVDVVEFPWSMCCSS